ncbi:AAA domain-containing protein [Blastocladiella britannica]|nr:AAA domain-containing protein [Blastocladiella britannica]
MLARAALMKSAPARRIDHLARLFRSGGGGEPTIPTQRDGEVLTIGDVSLPLVPPPNALIARVPGESPMVNLGDQTVLEHLEWMMKKVLLGQDIFLVGPPGPFKRHLALTFCHLTQRPVEYISLHRDISGDADIKQRREIVHDQHTNAPRSTARVEWVDGPAVRAAMHGSVLILDGVERAERNVLPVLNNLLENRELTLDDGRVLVHPHRFDALRARGVNVDHLVRTHHAFRVIALGVPVPKFQGNPLDPPFRSRFAARYVDAFVPRLVVPAASAAADVTPSTTKALKPILDLIDTVHYKHLTSLDGAGAVDHGADADLPRFPQSAKATLAALGRAFPADQWGDHLRLVYPTFALPGAARELLGSLRVQLKVPDDDRHGSLPAATLVPGRHSGELSLTIGKKGPSVPIPGHVTGTAQNHPLVFTPRVERAQIDILKLYALGLPCLVVGPKSAGKSHLVRHVLSTRLGLDTRMFYLYRDLPARDLLQRRGTDVDGNTVWEDSALVAAAVDGAACVLEGIEQVDAGAIASVARLLQDHEIELPDGTILVSARRADELARDLECSVAVLADRQNLRVVHPHFRVVAVATVAKMPMFDDPASVTLSGAPLAPAPTKPGKRNKRSASEIAWFSDDVREIFGVVELPAPVPAEQAKIALQVTGCSPKLAEQLAAVAETFKGHETFGNTLTLRQVIRLAQRPHHDLRRDLHRLFLTLFVPPIVRRAFDETLTQLGVPPSTQATAAISIRPWPKFAPVTDQDPSMIPHVPHYHPNALHSAVLADLADDWVRKEHLLLMGNQGVGKNVLVSVFLERASRAQQYMQLHRDSTVASLLVVPVVENGRVVYKDSPLILAVKRGHVAVIDEADKAPVHVVSVLKSLAETGEMTLTNGVRVVSPGHPNTRVNDIVVHPDFQMILLANRPGFPFLGNNFFRIVGDAFCCHPIDNLDPESEYAVLKRTAPTVPDDTLRALVAAFQELRVAFDDGKLAYPFSLRELLHLVRHIARYPDDALLPALRDFLDHDLHSPDLAHVVLPILLKHGITDVQGYTAESVAHPTGQQRKRLEIKKTSGPTSLSAPKHGKVDAKNDPHVGGNTWAGGTGGRDTAGLGGIGGPYRLDAGHDVHQVSDEVKAGVPEHVKRAAREMGQAELQKRLAEIAMGANQMDAYVKILDRVGGNVAALRRVFERLPRARDEDEDDQDVEREWLRHQTDGELDDARLVDGLAGDAAVYKRRGIPPHDPSRSPWDPSDTPTKPKRLRVVFDVSASMYRFNGVDGRLQRSLEAAAMLMEALARVSAAQVVWDFVGHSGDSAAIPLVRAGAVPANEKDRFAVLEQMVAHAQYCWAGDHTVEALRTATDDLARTTADFDATHVVLITDANLRRYGIATATVAREVERAEARRVKVAVLAIGQVGEQAEELRHALPPGRGFVSDSADQVPGIIRQIFAAAAGAR